MADLLDESQYTAQFQGDVPATLALVRSLESAALAATPAEATAGRAALAAARAALDQEWSKGDAATRDLHAIDHRVDAIWDAIFQRFHAYRGVPTLPSAIEAATFALQLFSSGKKFLGLTYASEWAESEKRIQQVKSKGQEARLKALVEDLAGACNTLLELPYTASSNETDTARTECRWALDSLNAYLTGTA